MPCSVGRKLSRPPLLFLRSVPCSAKKDADLGALEARTKSLLRLRHRLLDLELADGDVVVLVLLALVAQRVETHRPHPGDRLLQLPVVVVRPAGAVVLVEGEP